MCIKGIVFVTGWQGLAISLLATSTQIGPKLSQDDEELWGKQAQNFVLVSKVIVDSIY